MTANAQNASVYIDNAYIGKAPCKSDALKSGEYVVRIAKEMYEPFSERVIVRDNDLYSDNRIIDSLKVLADKTIIDAGKKLK